ncbi:MAG: glycosyltransferase [Anaerolineae bacterium]
MRIVHVYKDYYPVLGGIENHVRSLAEGQAERGHDVTVIVTSLTGHTETETMNGVRVVKAARLATVASTPLSLALPFHLRGIAADIAHLHFPYPVGEVSQWLVGRARRTVITYHSDVVRQAGILRLYKPLMRAVLRRADRIIATSPNYAATSPLLQENRDRVTIVPLGVDLARFLQPYPDPVAALRREYGTPMLLCMGRLRYYKGLHVLIEALPGLPDVTLVVAGSGPMGTEWQALAQRLGVGERVHFIGDVSDADQPALYQAADLYVLPATHRSEAFGIALVEALACGVPAVTTELGSGTSYVNQDGVTGVVVPPNASSALGAALRGLLADDALRRRMGEAARARAVAEFDRPAMLERVMAVYNDVLTR